MSEKYSWRSTDPGDRASKIGTKGGSPDAGSFEEPKETDKELSPTEILALDLGSLAAALHSKDKQAIGEAESRLGELFETYPELREQLGTEE
jgi:hypothetical protein